MNSNVVHIPDALAIVLAHGFDAGNYDSVYVSEDLDTAWGKMERTDEPAYRAAYVIGFFGSYETHEVSTDHVYELLVAHAEYGDAMRAQGIAVDDRDLEKETT